MSKPAWLIGNAVSGLQNLIAELDTIAALNKIDPVLAGRATVAVATAPTPSRGVAATVAPVTGIGNILVALYNVVPSLVSGHTGIDPGLAPGIVAAARLLGAAMAPSDALSAFASAIDGIGDAAPSPTPAVNRVVDTMNAQVVARVSRAALLAPYAEALVRQTYASRQDGITARADAVERFERELAFCVGALDAEVAQGLTRLRDAAVEYLSRQVAVLAPVVTVAAAVPLPSLWWAWRLYGDPRRATELVSRNGVPHPEFMPEVFEALDPQTRVAGRS